ncbi:MAG: TetR/AcrR family transcriptional regulator [Propionibacteriaceae bacterium]|nr:TetR/AcrR family transcriptional regulator [Propionibacteriaceae bacterium]
MSGRTPADDPRYQRVRQRLVDSLLELAASRPAETISVSELTTAAGVSRAVFYSHASSPAGLLADVLVGELEPGFDALAEQMARPDADYVEIWRRVYLTLLDHVRDHRAVYEVLTAHESAVSSALTAYLEQAASCCVLAVTSRFEGPPPTELWKTMAVNQQAHNMLAVIRAWIATGLTDPPEVVVDTYLTLAPPWQLARAEDGPISLRRVRSLRRARSRDRETSEP